MLSIIGNNINQIKKCQRQYSLRWAWLVFSTHSLVISMGFGLLTSVSLLGSSSTISISISLDSYLSLLQPAHSHLLSLLSKAFLENSLLSSLFVCLTGLVISASPSLVIFISGSPLFSHSLILFLPSSAISSHSC